MNGKKTILLVDDDKVILKSLSYKLESRGYRVQTEMDVVGVLSRLRGGPQGGESVDISQGDAGGESTNNEQSIKPDLILLDIDFPSEIDSVPWDGFLIMEWLKRAGDLARIPVIFISGSDPKLYEAKAREAGALGYLRKPVKHDELFEVLSKTLGEEAVLV